MAVLAVAFAACATDPRPLVPPRQPSRAALAAADSIAPTAQSRPRRVRWRRSEASWTGRLPAACYDHGRRTPHPAGELYWAAHRSIACGTRLMVCLDNDPARCVTVVIADRGPYVHGRDLDLSRAAFRRLAALSRGVLRVRYRILRSR